MTLNYFEDTKEFELEPPGGLAYEMASKDPLLLSTIEKLFAKITENGLISSKNGKQERCDKEFENRIRENYHRILKDCLLVMTVTGRAPDLIVRTKESARRSGRTDVLHFLPFGFVDNATPL